MMRPSKPWSRACSARASIDNCSAIAKRWSPVEVRQRTDCEGGSLVSDMRRCESIMQRRSGVAAGIDKFAAVTV